MGYRRVPTVTEVAEFSVRGGIVDLYGFGMAAPARIEWWGDEISSMRIFDLTTQRLGAELAGRDRPADHAAPAIAADDASPTDVRLTRSTLFDLLPGDALLLEEAGACRRGRGRSRLARGGTPSRDRPAARRGCPRRARISSSTPAAVARRGARVPPADPARRAARPPDRLLPARARRPRSRPAARHAGAGTPTLILCDNEGQLERLDELLEDNGFRPAGTSLRSVALDGGFVMPTLRVLTDHEIFRRARRLRRARRYRQAAPSTVTGDAHAGRLRGAPRARHRDLPRHRRRSRSKAAYHRGGGPRVRGRRPAERAALPSRPARALSRRR